MKRLFAVVAGGDTMYFDNKKKAKELRNQINTDVSRNARITHGPDPAEDKCPKCESDGWKS